MKFCIRHCVFLNGTGDLDIDALRHRFKSPICVFAMQTDFFDHFPPDKKRLSEVCGPASYAFAAVSAAYLGGKLLWIRENWLPDQLNPVALSGFFDPANILMAQTDGHKDSLGVAEEALKDGAFGLVVLEITRPIDFREGRRLHLAAKSGNSCNLCLAPEDMGTNAAQIRWQASPLANPESPDSTLLRLEIIKNKTGTYGTWHVQWNPKTHRLHVVSPVAERPGSSRSSG